MKLLVVSDVHGDLDALERAVDAEADADAVIFLGDGLREAEDLQDMRPELKIYSVRGNCDYASFAPPDGLAAFGGVLFYIEINSFIIVILYKFSVLCQSRVPL